MAYVYERVGRDEYSHQTPHYGFIDGENLLAAEGSFSNEGSVLVPLAPALLANFVRGPFIQNATTNSIQVIWRTWSRRLRSMPRSLDFSSVEYKDDDHKSSRYQSRSDRCAAGGVDRRPAVQANAGEDSQPARRSRRVAEKGEIRGGGAEELQDPADRLG